MVTIKSQAKSTDNQLSVKEKFAKKRQQQRSLQKFVTLAAVGVLLGIVIGIPIAILVDLKLGVVAPVAIVSLLWSYLYPRTALWFFLIYMPFGGTFVYTLGGGNPAFQLAKDVFYFGALIALLQECKQKKLPIIVQKKILPTLLLLVAFCALTYLFVNIGKEFLPYCSSLSEDERFLRDANGNYLIHPVSGLVYPTPCKNGLIFLQGIMGLKVLIGYIPLIFCAYYLIENKKQVIFLGRLLLGLTIVCCLLGLYQYYLLKTGICAGTRNFSGEDIFNAQLTARCFIGGSLAYNPAFAMIRLPGTFASPWHWAWFLISNSGIAFATTFSDPSLLWRMGGLAGLILVFINAVICGQRIALVMVPVFFIFMLVATGQIFKLKNLVPVAVGLGTVLGLAVFINQEIFLERVQSLVGRWNASPPHEFIWSQYQWAIQNTQGILGSGLGLATPQARFLGEISFVETFHARVFYEIGPLGLLSFLIFLTSLLIVSWRDYRTLKDPILRNYAASFWIIILLITYFPYWYPLDTDPVGVYYWFFAGVIFKMVAMEKQEKLQIIEDTKSSRKQRRKFFRKQNAYR